VRRIAAGLACLLFLLAAIVAVRAAEPGFPALSGRVVDEAGILDPEAEAALARDLEAHERATGNQVVVASLRSLQGLTVEEYANRLFRHWQLGRAKDDDGALLLVAPSERKVRIEVGYGLEGVLTDAAASTIIQSLILPRFRAGDLQGGVEAGARGLLELLRPDGQTAPAGWAGQETQQAVGGVPLPTLAILGFVLFIVLARLLQGRRSRDGRLRRDYGRRGFGYPPVIVVPGGGFGRGGGSGGGGGFSGGGGSSGGGGASGSW
jgi:uncharacterized protein